MSKYWEAITLWFSFEILMVMICMFMRFGSKYVFSITFLFYKRKNSNAFYLYHITNILKNLNMTNLQFFCNSITFFCAKLQKEIFQMHFICTSSWKSWKFWIWQFCNFFAIGLKYVFSITFFLHKVAKRNNSNAFYLYYITNNLKILNLKNLQFFCIWIAK